jgi:Xaa-Pro aminopeptidase
MNLEPDRQRSDLGRFGLGQFATDYEQRVDQDELRARRAARVADALDRSDLDGLLLWKTENLRYVTGMRAQIIQGKDTLLNGVLLLRDRDPVLLCSGGELERVENVMTWIAEAHPIPILEARGLIRGFVEGTLAPLLRQHGVAAGRLGVDECAFAQVEEIRRALPELELADGDGLMQKCRRLKLPEEIALMEEASAIAEAVTDAAVAAAAPGVREYDVVAEALHTLYRLGGEMPHVATPFVASGEHMSPPNRLSSDKILRNGDIVFIDIGAMWGGYFSDVARTVVCGEPNAEQRRVYRTVYDALQAGMAALSPGNTNADVATAIVDVARRAGLDEHFITLFIGHGVGMGSNEPPYIGETLPGAETVVLEPGMTFAVEPLIWLPGVPGGCGVRLEDTILVDEGGARALTRCPFDERLLA